MFYENKIDFFVLFIDFVVCCFVDINYGLWDRLNGDSLFISGYEEKVFGVEFYFYDIIKDVFNKVLFVDKDGLYLLVCYDVEGNFFSIFYSEVYVVLL